jgi:hypothetical protein
MTNNAKKFKNLQALEYEIRRLKTHSKALEKQFDDNISQIQENYIPMFLNSVLPKQYRFKGIPATVLSFFLDNERFRNTFIGLSEEVIDRISDGIDYLSEKLRKKQD